MNDFMYNPYGYTGIAALIPHLAYSNQNKKQEQPSMVDIGTQRAQAAYDAVINGMQTNPAYNQSVMFPSLLSPSAYNQLPSLYGAGRFTGGLLGMPSFNYNAPTK